MIEEAIVIPTYRRMTRIATLRNLPDELRQKTFLVVDQADADLKRPHTQGLRGIKLLVHPPDITSIAKKRSWIIRALPMKKIVMLDDDLRFAVRSSPDSTALRQATGEDLLVHFRDLFRKLDEYAHVGWSARQGNNNQREAGFHENCRMCYVLGYDASLLRVEDGLGRIRLGQIETREDMDLTLQLMKEGWPNTVSFSICADQVSGYAADGGCSEQRTLESSNADAMQLAELHPGLVKVVEKQYSGSLPRQEVVVQWKKAWEIGKAKRITEGTL